MTFGSVEELEQYIISKIPTAVEISMKDVNQIMQYGLENFYGSYSPEMYSRTGALKSSLKPPEVMATGRGAIGRDKYDSSGMSYSTGAKPSGDAVLNTAMAGGHGVFGLKVAAVTTPVWSFVEGMVGSQIDGIVKHGLTAAGLPVK